MQYKPFPLTPYIYRDISFWKPDNSNDTELLNILNENKSYICWKIYLQDEYTQDNKISLTFRFIFQVFNRTLTNQEVDLEIDKINNLLEKHNCIIR